MQMKIELPVVPPAHIQEQWEGQFSVFSYYAFVIDVPSPVFIVTTLKENGLANAALSAWGMMAGSGKEPKFLLQVHNYTESRRLIEQNGEFVINFPSIGLYRQMRNTVNRYDGQTDEILASGLTPEPSAAVKAPRVAECFACLECRVDWLRDIETDVKVSTLVQASVVHAAIDGSVACDSARESHRLRQWAYDIQEPINPANGVGDGGLFASLDLENPISLSELW
jgi:flavin reductase (DIM6/NTAB) family NADH-FMN oxidoreductase RutF